MGGTRRGRAAGRGPERLSLPCLGDGQGDRLSCRRGTVRKAAQGPEAAYGRNVHRARDMKRIGIIAKDTAKARKAVRQLSRWLTSRGRKVLVEESAAASLGIPG